MEHILRYLLFIQLSRLLVLGVIWELHSFFMPCILVVDLTGSCDSDESLLSLEIINVMCPNLACVWNSDPKQYRNACVSPNLRRWFLWFCEMQWILLLRDIIHRSIICAISIWKTLNFQCLVLLWWYISFCMN